MGRLEVVEAEDIEGCASPVVDSQLESYTLRGEIKRGKEEGDDDGKRAEVHTR
jgi:hypothetical protein